MWPTEPGARAYLSNCRCPRGRSRLAHRRTSLTRTTLKCDWRCSRLWQKGGCLTLLPTLEECDGDTEVRIMPQKGWPFENVIRGIAIREGLASEGCERDRRIDEAHEEGCPATAESYGRDSTPTMYPSSKASSNATATRPRGRSHVAETSPASTNEPPAIGGSVLRDHTIR